VKFKHIYNTGKVFSTQISPTVPVRPQPIIGAAGTRFFMRQSSLGPWIEIDRKRYWLEMAKQVEGHQLARAEGSGHVFA
jgi:hypothetical protein